jgi:peroxiredoxin
MALTSSLPDSLGRNAPDFALPGVDGRMYSLSDFREARALVIVFMCNHCPYVQAVDDRLNALAKEYASRGMCLIGISSNDPVAYPDDSFEEMRKRAKLKGYVFPYLFDETQEVARAYGAVCTPDIYAFENVGGEFLLRYRGRLDDSWKDPSQVRARDLARAVDCILEGQPVPADQKASMGCSIKWKK